MNASDVNSQSQNQSQSLPEHRTEVTVNGNGQTDVLTIDSNEDENYFIRFANGLMNETNALVSTTMERLGTDILCFHVIFFIFTLLSFYSYYAVFFQYIIILSLAYISRYSSSHLS